MRNHPLHNLALRAAASAAALAGVKNLGVLAGKRQDALANQRVMHHDIRLPKPRQGMKRQKPGIPRPRARQPNLSAPQKESRIARQYLF